MKGVVVAALMVSAALAEASAETRRVKLVPGGVAREVVECAAGHTTRIVLPPGVKRARMTAGARELLGAQVVGRRPELVISASPTSASGSGRIVAELESGSLELELRATASGGDRELRLIAVLADVPKEPAAAVAPSPASSPKGVATDTRPPKKAVALPSPGATVPPRGPTAAPSRSTAPTPAPPLPAPTPTVVPSDSATAWPVAPSPGNSSDPEASSAPADSSPKEVVDLRELQLAKRVRIGRREGLPGQRSVELEDALQGGRSVWLRFRVIGGSHLKVARVEWEHGLVGSVVEERGEKDLHVVVQLPRGRVTKGTRVRLRLSDGADYSFALSSPWFSTFVRSLFE